MGSTFNPQILVEKLAKLNNSQQSIETLSHWCIFHMNKARQVVETWARQFHCSPRDQRLAFLYLANDILQNSRRKGSEFVGEFWKVLPDALRDVTEFGDEFGRNAALRLVSIWEERKVFGSRGQILKEGLVGRHLENTKRNGNPSGFKLKQCGSMVEKIVSSYQAIYGGQMDEDVILRKCQNAITFVEKVDKEMNGDLNADQLHESGCLEELQGQNGVLRECIEQLVAVETSRSSLVSNLREALQEQEYKLEQVRSQLQAAQAHSEQARNMCQILLNGNDVHSQSEADRKEVQTSNNVPQSFTTNGEQSAPVMYARQGPYSEKSGNIEEDPRKAAAAVAAKLTASTSSAEMLTFVLSSLASEGVIGNNSMKESSGDYQIEKKPKVDNDHSAYVPPQNPQPPLPPYSNAESQPQNVTTTSQQLTSNEQPPPPSSSSPPLPPMPLMAPFPVPPFMQSAGSIPNVPYSYSVAQQLQPPSLAGYPAGGAPVTGMSPFSIPPPNSYQNFSGSEGAFYSQQQQSSLSMAPISRQ